MQSLIMKVTIVILNSYKLITIKRYKIITILLIK